MTDLTELPEKLYWVKFNGDIVIMDKCNGYFLSGDVPVDYDKIEQILAPVPSYEEWQKLKSEYEAECHRSDELEDSFWKEHKENAKLKDLLKEIRSKIKIVYDFDTREFTNIADYDNDLLTKIDEVLK